MSIVTWLLILLWLSSQFSFISTGTYEFIPCKDVSLISEVKRTVSPILAKHSKINFLVLTAGALSPTSSKTSEGLDKRVALHYYSRWTFIHGLLPALQAARDAGEDAKVMSVYATGERHEGAVNNDLMCDVC